MDEITKGFNHGFIIKKYSSVLSEQIMNQFNNSDYEKAFEEGLKESERERKIEQLRKLRDSKENEMDIER